MWGSRAKHGIHSPHKIFSWEDKLQCSQNPSSTSFFAPAFIIEHDTMCYTVWVSCPGCVSSQLPVHCQYIAVRAVWEAEMSMVLSKLSKLLLFSPQTQTIPWFKPLWRTLPLSQPKKKRTVVIQLLMLFERLFGSWVESGILMKFFILSSSSSPT